MPSPREEGTNPDGMRLCRCYLKPTLTVIIVMQILVCSTVSYKSAFSRSECCLSAFKSRHESFLCVRGGRG